MMRHRYFLLILLCWLITFSPPSIEAAEKTPQPLSSIIAAIPSEFPPQYSIDKDGRSVGFAIDVMDAIASLAGIKVKYEIKKTWRDTENALSQGKVHLIPNLGISEKRKQYSIFTSPIETFQISAFVKKGSTKYQHIDDLNGQIVGAIEANIGERLLSAKPDIETVLFPNFQDALLALLSGRVEAIVYPQSVARQLTRNMNLYDQIHELETPLKEIKRAIAVRKDLPELLSTLQTATDQFMGSNAYEQIYAKWYGEQKQPWFANRIFLAIISFSVLVAMGFAGKYFVRKRLYKSRSEHFKDLEHVSEASSAFRTLTTKLLAIYVPLVTFAVIIMFMILEIIFYQTEREQLVTSLNNVAAIQSTSFQDAVWEYDIDQIRQLLGELLLLPNIQGAAVYDSSGNVMGEVGDVNGQIERPEFKAEVPLIASSGASDEIMGQFVLVVHSEQIWLEVIDNLKTNALILLVLMASIIASTMFAVHVVIGRPLNYLRQAIENAKAGNERSPVMWESSDELGQVVRAYNEMQEKEAVAEKEIKKYQENLETLVDERTQELAHKEGLLRMALDNMPGGMIVVNKDLELTLVNEQYKKFYGDADGLSRAGSSMRDILRKEIELGYISGEGGVEEILENRLKTFTPQSAVTIQDTVQGGRVIQLVRSPTPDGHTVSIATDITEVIEARRGEKLLREALDTFYDMVILYDKTEKVIFTNNKYHEIYPHSPPKDEIVNYTMETLMRRSLKAGQIDQPLAKSDPEAWLKAALEKRRNRDGSHGETTHANGQTYFFRNAWTSEGGMILVQFDITERKLQEDRIRRSEEQLHRILENSPVAVMISLDDQSADDGIVQFANSQLLGMVGIDETSIGHINTNSFVPTGEARDSHDKALDEGKSLRNTEQLVHSIDGRDLWTLMSISPIVFKERQAALVWFYDITERKMAEEKLTIAHQKLGDAMMHIEGSIDYASRIQRSILPDNSIFESILADYFIKWLPRDIVGGDIYWANRWGDGAIIVLGDCTGHGVPGAFMSLIATGAMREALLQVNEGDCNAFLGHIHNTVQTSLGQYGKGEESDDGMELGVCYFEKNLTKMVFAGARFDLFIIEDEEISAIKSTKQGIGYSNIPHDQQYSEFHIELTKGKSFYMTTDGFVDQIGGERRRMFGKKRFKDLLLSVQDKPMSEQKEDIMEALHNYQGDEIRRDDISLIGFKV